MFDDNDEEELGAGLLFGGGDEEEEEDQEVKTTTDSYQRKRPAADPCEITVHLIASHHSLWGEHLWNASIVLADIYDEPEFVLEGKHVMELGAGAGLPGLICALNGAARVVITDYGTEVDASLVEVIQQNSKCPFLKGNYLNRLMCAPPFSLVESLRDHYPQGVQVYNSPSFVHPIITYE